jgi:hypothetical protein
MHKKLLYLFNKIFDLAEQHQIKDIYTPITIEKLNHDYDLDDKIEKYVKKLGTEIEKAKKTNTVIDPNFIKLYEIYSKRE